MAKQVQLRRGTRAANAVFVGATGEVSMDTESKDLRLHDGSTVGGFRIPSLVAVQYPTADNGYTWYRKWSDGWCEQGGTYIVSAGSSNITAEITYPIEMADTTYTRLFGQQNDTDLNWNGFMCYVNPTTTGTTLRWWNNGGQSVKGISWEIKGMAA